MELKFGPDTKERKQWFTAVSFSHPAKMSLPLQLWIIDNYTREGDVILDPMAGSGTILVGCSMGRNIIAVELEEKFIKIMEGNWEKIKQRGPQLGYPMGWAKIIQGDARKLEGLVDGIITSPPYAVQEGGKTTLKRVGESSKTIRHYAKNPNNIDELSYGSIDSVITSPPYEEAMGEKHHSPRADKMAQEKSNPVTYTEKVDSIVTSPPYEGSLSEPEDRKHSIDQTKWKDGRRIAPPHSQVHLTYPSSSESNIGNLKAESYLSAMLQVYQQCHKVLKPPQILCKCGIINVEVNQNGQTLPGGILRRGGIYNMVPEGGETNSGAKGQGDIRANQGLLGEPRLSEHIPLQSEIQIHPTQRQTSRGIQATGSQLPGHQDNTQRPNALSDSQEKGCDKDIGRDREETQTYREIKRRGCCSLEEIGVIINQDRQILSLLKQENTSNSAQEQCTLVCSKCGEPFQYKAGGLLILVTKNFIRDRKIVRLDLDTIKLCEQAGFTLLERHYRKLTTQSFWRVIYKQKYPDAPVIDKEDILVFRRES